MKRILLAGVIVALWTGGYARQLSPEEAVGRVAAKAVGSVAVGQSRRAAAYRGVSPKMTLRDRQGNNCVYLFSDGSGFMLLSADDCGAPVLGYGDTPLTDTVQMPPAMRAWVAGYTRQIEAAIKADAPAYAAPAKEEKKEISPILTTQWNQWSPYNDQCPVYDDENNCVTGCVVTAMAQIMYRHAYPDKGTGSHLYTDEIRGNNVTLSADFGNTTYNWSAMLPKYDKKSSEAARAEVAKLMAHLGVATEMDYDHLGSNQSAVSLIAARDALIRYFGYSPAMVYDTKATFSDDEWADKLYGELSAGRPLLYEGNTNGSGHAFVCDGYSSLFGEYYHFNWGWGGAADGWFVLTALRPQTGSQAGGGNYDYTDNQAALFGIRPARQGDAPYPKVIAYGDLYTKNARANMGDEVKVDMINDEYNAFYNQIFTESGDPCYWCGLEFTSKADGKKYYMADKKKTQVPTNHGQYSLYVPLVAGAAPTGDYEVRPVACLDASGKPSGKWERVRIQDGRVDSFDSHVGRVYATFENSKTDSPVIEVARQEGFDEMKPGQPYSINVGLSVRNAKCSAYIGVYVVSPDGKYKKRYGFAAEQVDLAPGRIEWVSIGGTLPADAEKGSVVCLADNDRIFHEIFVIGEDSGAGSVTAAARFRVRSGNGTICVEGVEPEHKVNIYSVSGTRLMELTADSEGRAAVSSCGFAGGVYIIKADNYSEKIILK